jgi:hypothetical protein
MPGDPTLVRASIHHQQGLARARALRRAARGGRDVRERAGWAFVEYFDAEVLPHCHDEERTLFPLMLAHHAPAEVVTLTLAEHEWLQVLVRRLRASLDAGPPERETLEAIAALLLRHIAREELELMPFVRGLAAAPSARPVVPV